MNVYNNVSNQRNNSELIEIEIYSAYLSILVVTLLWQLGTQTKFLVNYNVQVSCILYCTWRCILNS